MLLLEYKEKIVKPKWEVLLFRFDLPGTQIDSRVFFRVQVKESGQWKTIEHLELLEFISEESADRDYWL